MQEHVRANPNKLDPRWFMDLELRSEIHAKIRSMKRRGWTQAEIALELGVSQRCVSRVTSPTKPVGSHPCGAVRRPVIRKWRRPKPREGACSIPVRDGEVHCHYHR